MPVYQAVLGNGAYATRGYVLANAVAASRKVSAGTGLDGGGDLSADRTFSVKPRYFKKLLAQFVGPVGYFLANQVTPVKLLRDTYLGALQSFWPQYSGSIAEIRVDTNQQDFAGGTVTLELYKNDAATGVQLIIPIGTADYYRLPLGRGVLSFAPSDRFDLRYSTPSGYTPNANLVGATIYGWDTTTSLGVWVDTCGDSIVEGYGLKVQSVYQDPTHPTAAGESWPAILSALTGTPVINRGSSGTTAQLFISQSGATITADFSTGAILTLSHGTNDILANGRSSSQVITDITANAVYATAIGYRVALGTILPRTASQSVINAVNAWIRTSGYPVIDFAAIAHAADPTNVTYYQDGTHPTAVLAAEMGALAASVLAAAYG